MWLRKPLHVRLSPHSVVVEGNAIPYTTLPCVQTEFTNEPWQPAVSALTRLLAGKNRDSYAIQIALSGQLVRWQLLPWQADITGADEFAAYAALCFYETYGDTARNWHLQSALQPPGGAIPVCATDNALLDSLRETCQYYGHKLVSVSPCFANAFDHWRGAFKEDTVWFGLLEQEVISLGLLHKRTWAGLRTQRLPEDNWQDAIAGMMAQSVIASGFGQAVAPLYLAGKNRDDKPPVVSDGLPFTWLQPANDSSGISLGT